MQRRDFLAMGGYVLAAQRFARGEPLADGRVFEVRIAAMAPDERPALYCDDVDDLRIDRLDTTKPKSSEPPVRLVNVRNSGTSYTTPK